jgi:cell division septation protein DedD
VAPLPAIAPAAVARAEERAPSVPQPGPWSTEPVSPIERRFYLLAGAYDVESQARDLAARLGAYGYTSYLERQETPDGTFYQVFAGRYASRDEALAAADALEAQGVQCVISERREPPSARVTPAPAQPIPPAAAATEPTTVADGPPASYVLHAGSFSSEANARKQLERLEKKGFSGYLYHKETPDGPSIHVIAGKYATRREALDAAARLKGAKIDHFISEGK